GYHESAAPTLRMEHYDSDGIEGRPGESRFLEEYQGRSEGHLGHFRHLRAPTPDISYRPDPRTMNWQTSDKATSFRVPDDPEFGSGLLNDTASLATRPFGKAFLLGPRNLPSSLSH